MVTLFFCCGGVSARLAAGHVALCPEISVGFDVVNGRRRWR
jgi:hypothetical protein